ncbi:hypothetical protein V8D89_000794 [Ganoderma adspersum]
MPAGPRGAPLEELQRGYARRAAVNVLTSRAAVENIERGGLALSPSGNRRQRVRVNFGAGDSDSERHSPHRPGPAAMSAADVHVKAYCTLSERLSLFGRGPTSDREEDSDGVTSRTKHFAAPTPPRFDRFQCPPRNRTTQAASARRGEIPATSCAPATSARAQDVDHEPGGVEPPLTSSLRTQTLTTDRLPAGPGNPGFSAPAFSFSLPRAWCRGSPSRRGLRPIDNTHPRPPDRAAFSIAMAVSR